MLRFEVIYAKDLNKYVNNKRALIIDVRSPKEFEKRHIESAINIPFEKLERGARRVARRYSKLFCNTGRQVIVPTDKVKMLLQRYQVEKDIAVIPTGIDLCKFDHTYHRPQHLFHRDCQ